MLEFSDSSDLPVVYTVEETFLIPTILQRNIPNNQYP